MDTLALKFKHCTTGCAFINGDWVEVSDTFATINPSTEETIAHVANCGPAEVDAAVLAARSSLESSDWGYKSIILQRIAFLRALAGLLEASKEDLAILDSLDEGKPLRESRADIGDAISLTRHLADLLEAEEKSNASTDGEVVYNGTSDFTTRVFREPVGVVAAITPWYSAFPFIAVAIASFYSYSSIGTILFSWERRRFSPPSPPAAQSSSNPLNWRL